MRGNEVDNGVCDGALMHSTCNFWKAADRPLLCIRQWKRKALDGTGVLEMEGLFTLTLEKEDDLRPMERVKKSVQKRPP